MLKYALLSSVLALSLAACGGGGGSSKKDMGGKTDMGGRDVRPPTDGPGTDTPRPPCNTAEDCNPGEFCIEGMCVPPAPPDGGVDMGGIDMPTGPLGSGQLTTANSRAAMLLSPFDATPRPDGQTIYFTAIDPMTGAGGVYRVPCVGGAPTLVAGGLDAPISISVSSDGTKLYVADVGIEGMTGDGSIMVVAAGGGMPTVLTGSEGYSARGIDVVSRNGSDVVFFTGNDKTTGAPGVFSIPAGGGAVTTLSALGGEPSGVGAASNGDVYFANLDSTSNKLVKINQDGDTVVLANLKLGYPAGIALSQDEKFLLASGKDPINGSATIIRVDLVSGMPVSFTTGIDTIFEPAGLHRAKNSDKYAWVNSGDDGSVWELGTSATPACQ
jgi:hypothetical protein